MMKMSVYQEMQAIVERHRKTLQHKNSSRLIEMESDDTSHHLMYEVLGIGAEEGALIDTYQNRGRFLYKYAGSLIEELTIFALQQAHPEAKKHRVPNTVGTKPKNFGIDCLVDKKAYEIKWRDGTTDGDHINKEKTRIQVIKDHGFTPVRIMYYLPNRESSKRVQESIRKVYENVGGEYYVEGDAWRYIKEGTGIDLLAFLMEQRDVEEAG